MMNIYNMVSNPTKSCNIVSNINNSSRCRMFAVNRHLRQHVHFKILAQKLVNRAVAAKRLVTGIIQHYRSSLGAGNRGSNFHTSPV